MSEIETDVNTPEEEEEPRQLVGMRAIVEYFTRKIFPKLYSQVHEVSESQIDDILSTAWRDVFDEDPPTT